MKTILFLILSFLTIASFGQIKKTANGKTVLNYKRIGNNIFVNYVPYSDTVTYYSESYAGTVYYVSRDGSDDNPGTKAEPFLTIDKARTMGLSSGDAVLLNSQDTFVAESITIIASGSSGSPITYSAYGVKSLKPVISGFTTVTGWTDRGGGIYKKYISTTTDPNILMIDGVQYGLGRYPNSSNLTYESHSTTVSITDNELTGTPDWTGAIAVIWKNDWSIDRCLITDHVDGTLTYTDLGTDYEPVSNQYFIQNDIRTLDQFGEWYYGNGDTLYVYFGETDPTTVITKVSTLSNGVLNNTGIDYITIKDIAFEGLNKSTIYFNNNSTNITVQNCDISYSAGGIALWGQYATVDGCNISHINGFSEINHNRDGAIYTDAINATITNNTISDIGMIIGQANRLVYTVAIMTNGGNTVIENNKINRTAYSGTVSYADATNSIIRYNYIDSTGQYRQDAGAIYVPGTNSNFRISKNIATNSGGNGIYLDNWCVGTKVDGNTVYNSVRNGAFVNMGHNDTLSNNTFYKNGYGSYSGINYENWQNDDYLYDNHTEGNIVVADSLNDGVIQLINRYTGAGSPEVGFFGDNYYVMSAVDSTKFITNFPSVQKEYWKFSQWKPIIDSDYTSEALPLVYGDNVLFQYNATMSNMNYYVADSARDVAGNWYVDTTIVIEPYQSIVLFKTFTLPAPPEPIYAYGDILQESFEGTGYENTWAEVVGANDGVLVDEDNTTSTITGGGSQVLKTVSAIVPTATATASRAYATHTASVSKQAMFADFWIYIDSHDITASSAQSVAVLQDSTSAANTCIGLYAYNNSGTLKFYVTVYSNGGTVATNAGTTPEWVLDTWYHAQMEYDITNMTYAVNINGVDIFSGSLTGAVRANIKKFRLGANATTTVTALYDLINLDTSTFSNY